MDADKFLESTGNVLNTVPQLYDDGLKDATKESGKLLARIPRAINAALSGVDAWILQREYNLEATKQLLAAKLENTDPQKIVKPDLHIAIPALQAIAYSMDSDELRDMYANLLAKAMHADLKTSVRAAFVWIIQQMEPIDATNLRLFRGQVDGLPVAQYRKILVSTAKADRSHDFELAQTNVFISNPDNLDIEAQAVSLSALERLGLLTIDWSLSVSDFDYSQFENTDMHHLLKSQVTPPPAGGYKIPRDLGLYKSIVTTGGVATLTPLGSAFLDVCL